MRTCSQTLTIIPFIFLAGEYSMYMGQGLQVWRVWWFTLHPSRPLLQVSVTYSSTHRCHHMSHCAVSILVPGVLPCMCKIGIIHEGVVQKCIHYSVITCLVTFWHLAPPQYETMYIHFQQTPKCIFATLSLPSLLFNIVDLFIFGVSWFNVTSMWISPASHC